MRQSRLGPVRPPLRLLRNSLTRFVQLTSAPAGLPARDRSLRRTSLDTTSRQWPSPSLSRTISLYTRSQSASPSTSTTDLAATDARSLSRRLFPLPTPSSRWRRQCRPSDALRDVQPTSNLGTARFLCSTIEKEQPLLCGRRGKEHIEGFPEVECGQSKRQEALGDLLFTAYLTYECEPSFTYILHLSCS